MNIVAHSPEQLVFRDGRPFGAFGSVYGGMLRWPLPSTIAGMIRTRVGLARDADFFAARSGDIDKNIEEIKKVGVGLVLPVWRDANQPDRWRYLFPAPADALVTVAATGDAARGDEQPLRVRGYQYLDPFARGGGIDLPWRNWRIPVCETRQKPAPGRPELWTRDNFFQWLRRGELDGSLTARELGLGLPPVEIRMHSAIDPASGVVRESHLFAALGIRLEKAAANGRVAGRLGIAVTVDDPDGGRVPLGPCKLGGEGRSVLLEELRESFPGCPVEWFAAERFLRLVLLTPGNFGAWAPEWLLPVAGDEDGDGDGGGDENRETPWRAVPGTDIDIRLCSAFIGPWQAMSGWDYHRRGPKATRKLVPAGSVYVVELRQPERARELAELLWARSLDQDLTNPDGFGRVCVGPVRM